MAQDEAPQFPPDQESPHKAIGDALVALDALTALSSKNVRVQPVKVQRPEIVLRERSRASAFFASVLLHFAVVFFLVRVPFAIFLRHRESHSFQLPQIVYEFHEIELPQDLPALKPPGPGGEPGKGTHLQEAPARGSTAFHPKVTVVSNPPNPDNHFQTILQPSVPHNVIIKMNLHLPNIIMGGVLPVPGPPPPVPPPPMKLTVPSTLHSLTVPQVAVASPTPPNLIIPASSTPNLPPIPMPQPPPPPLEPQLTPRTPTAPVIPNVGIVADANGSSSRLLVLSLNPAPPASSISIPAGNRYGAFSISPGGNQPGSPSGVNGGTLNGGEGGPGSGGDNSTGVGPGNRGGGGNGGGKSNLAVSTSGTAASGGTGMGGSLAAAAAAKLIYPILRPPPKNRFAMVVTAGPVGGGGLHVYGVLTGGKVYTVFLPMPQKNWILQYCATDGDDHQASSQSPSVSVALSFGLLPPDVEKRFDFHRPSLPADQKSRMIILHGIIDKDGSVQKLRIYQGVQEIADQAALAAFNRWKFKPALKDGKPIAVEILVGIPVS
ncbi:MAG: energy transducer TonB [Acidobacteria bacterium]|nr:energy transducer TonB [Acidobacteriota bacterium]